MPKRKDFFGLRYPNHEPVYLDRLGSEFQVSGVLLGGKYGLKVLLMLPDEDVGFSSQQIKIVQPSRDEWIQALKQMDDPEYYETSSDGKTVKAIHRKSQRQIASQVQWGVYRKAGFKCEFCGHARPLTIDHYLPVDLGGTDEPSNLKAACRPCNKRKGNMSPKEWEEANDN